MRLRKIIGSIARLVSTSSVKNQIQRNVDLLSPRVIDYETARSTIS